MLKIFLLFSQILFSQNTGTTTAIFLRFPPGARPSGMGNAFTSKADDYNALHFNPAGIVNIKRIEFGGSYTKWFEDISNSFVGVVIPFERLNIGASAIYLNIGETEVRDASGNLLENASLYDFAIQLTAAKKIGIFNLGGSLKQIRQKYADISGSGVGVDIGGLVRLNNFGFGMSFLNLGPEIKIGGEKNKIATTVKFGVDFNFFEKLNILFDIDKPKEKNLQLHFGGEYLFKQYTIRAGYSQINKLSTQEGLTLGFGMKFLPPEYGEVRRSYELAIDYSIGQIRDFGFTHKLSFVLKI